MRHSLTLLAFAASVAITPGLARADGVDLATKVTAPAPQAVASQTDLTTQVSGLQTHIQLGMQTGAAPAGALSSSSAGWWDSGSANVSAVWSPTTLARVEVAAQNSVKLQVDPADPAFIDGGEHYVQTRQSAARAAVTLTPAAPLDVKLGAAATDNQVHDTALTGPGVVASDVLQTQAQQMFGQVRFKPLAAVAFDGGGKLESTGVYWAGARAGSFALLDPSVGATVKPWTGASWRFSLDRAATPLSPDQFVGYAAVGAVGAVPATAMLLQPNREWRYQAVLQQKAGAVDLTASVTEARLETYAYVAPWGSNAGRVDVGSGDRSEVQAGLAAPISLFGLAPLTFKASGVWRASEVQDPLSGVIGRLSGEHPYDASLSLSQALGQTGMRWGMTAQAVGAARSYLATQVTTVSATAGLGGFLEYRPGPIALHLQLDNLLGGDRDQRDVYYAGPRDLNVIDHSDALRTTDRAIRLSLVTAL